MEERIRKTTTSEEWIRFFSFEHRRYLYSRNGPGSFAWVLGASRVAEGTRLPTLLFLHGMNEKARMYPRFDGGPEDLRLSLRALFREGKIGPFLVLAPTHTRFATAAKVMWQDFDASAFLAAAENAMDGRVHVDPSRILLVGHSGAGCNTSGGLLTGGVSEILAVDPCMDERVNEAWTALMANKKLTFVYEPHWFRETTLLREACSRSLECSWLQPSPAESLGKDPHGAILPWALGR